MFAPFRGEFISFDCSTILYSAEEADVDTGDMQSSAFNPIRDTVFLGNQCVYDFTKNAFVFAAGAMIPIGSAYSAGTLTLRSGSVIVAEELLSEGAGFLVTKAGEAMDLNPTATMLLSIAASMGTSAGLGKLDQAYNVFGSFPKVDVTTTNPASMIDDIDGSLAKADIDIPKTVTIVGEQAPDYIKLSDDLGEKIEIDGYKIIDVEDAAQANKEWAIIGYDKPPVADGTKVYNVEAGDFSYSRVFCINSKSKPKSPFILRTDDIEGLNATQIAEKYALPQVPDKIVNIHMPPESPLEVSIVGPQPDWGTLGGDVQYTIKDVIPKSAWFTDISDLN